MNLHKNSNPWLCYNQIGKYIPCICTGNFIFQHDNDATAHIAKAREYFLSENTEFWIGQFRHTGRRITERSLFKFMLHSALENIV